MERFLEMKLSRKIFFSLVSIVTVSFIFSFFISSYFLHMRMEDEVKAGMYDELVLIRDLDVDPDQLELRRMRLTMISPDGTVLYDSDAEGELENHLMRPEVQEAISHGYGEDKRRSDTLLVDMLYMAISDQEGNVIRLSLPIDSIYYDMLNLMPPFIIVLLLLFAVILILSYCITKWVMKPLDSLDFSGNVDTPPYDELLPLTERLNRQKIEIEKQMTSLQRQKDETSLIIKGISDGIVLFRDDGTILMMNDGVRNIFSLPKDANPNSILELSRSTLFFSILDNKGEGQGKIKVGERTIDVRATPSDGLGAVMFLFDVSEKERIERREREFVENISHEIRTPLTSISGYSELLERGAVTEENIVKFSHLIHKEALRLKSLSDDILLLSSLDGKSRIDMSEDVDIVAVSESVKEYFAGKGDVSISVKSPLVVKGNSSLLEEALVNLVGNSIKYNRNDNPIEIIISSDRVTVKDQGIGISELDKDRIFERFYRVDKSRSRETGGTGLGLSIVNEIVELHGAKISVESELGVGSSFSIIFK